MFGRSQVVAAPVVQARPHLDLSGPRLRRATEALVAGADTHGGIERYMDALKLKSAVFREALASDAAGPGRFDVEAFRPLCAFMPTVRRRIVPWLEEPAYATLRAALEDLLEPGSDTSGADARIARFCAAFPQDDHHRWTRDLAAELLHNLDPERYPLMTRWVWDMEANTGVLREVWHGPDTDHTTLRVRDDYETFLVLREEIAQFLATNGVFRDVLQMVDLVCAQVYAEYICEQGGSYLRADFSAPEDPMQHTRRLLGLDGVRAADGRARFAAIDGEAREAFASPPPLPGMTRPSNADT
jgi:hypothetical protein